MKRAKVGRIAVAQLALSLRRRCLCHSGAVTPPEYFWQREARGIWNAVRLVYRENRLESVLRALVVGDSGGIGAAVAARLRGQGAEVVGVSRRDGFDVADPAAAEAVLEKVEGPFDLVFVAIGALTVTQEKPEKALRDVDGAELAAVFAVNAIGPAMVMKVAPRLMARGERGVFAALSARVGSIGDNRAGGWYSYRASKAALNQIVKTGAIELGRTHRQAVCVAMHPGTVATEFTANYPAHEKVSAAQAAKNLLAVMDGLTPAHTGGFFDYAGRAIDW